MFRSMNRTFPVAVPTAAYCAMGQQARLVTYTDTDEKFS